MKKDKISSNLLVLISVLFILTVFSIPTLSNLKDKFNNYKYDEKNENIINSVKSKYAGDVSNLDKNKEYTIKELIDEGFLKGNEINPITGKKYNDDDKVSIIEKNGILTFKYVDGKTLIEIVKSQKDVLNLEDNYYYAGENPNNFLNFNEEIYRIIGIDNKEEAYIIKDELLKKVEETEIMSFLKSYINDNFKEEYRKLIIDEPFVITNIVYSNTLANDKTFLGNENYIWIKNDNEYKVYDSLSKEYAEMDKAWVNPILKIDGNNIINKGNGTRLNPYSIY